MSHHLHGAALSFALVLASGQAIAQTETHSYIRGAGGQQLFDDEFAKCVQNELGEAYQNLQIVVASCFSGGFADEASAALKGNWSLNSARDKTHKLTLSRTNDPHNKVNGKEGIKIGNRWYHGWSPQWIKKLTADKDATAQALADFAKANDHLTGGNPQFVHAGTGKDAKVHDGVKSNHALIWSPESSSWEDDMNTQLVMALEAAGYDKDTIDYAYGNKGGTKVKGKDVDRDATEANLKQMLKDLRTDLNAHPAQEKGFIFLYGHGGTERRKAEKKDLADEDQPFQGKKIMSGGSTSLEFDDPFRNLLLEDLTVDDPELSRVSSPSLLVSTTEETFAGEVSVLVDGLDAGSLVLQGVTFGADYEISLAESLLLDLDAQGMLDDGTVDVSFLFDDDPQSMFRIATEWDFSLPEFDLSHYGVGLTSGAFLSKVPAPGPGVLMLMGGLAIIRRRRHRRDAR